MGTRICAAILASIATALLWVSPSSAITVLLDPTYGTNGEAVIDLSSQGITGGPLRELAIQADDKVVVSGRAHNGATYETIVARLNTDGSLDATFDGDGVARHSLGANEFERAIAIQNDSKIVVAQPDCSLLRLNTDGSLDATFSGDGVATVTGIPGALCRTVSIQNDGKLITTGGSPGGVVVVRYNANGTLDTGFDGDGVLVSSAAGGGLAAALQSDGKLVVLCYRAGGPRLIRFNSNGTLDTNFDGDGVATVTVVYESELAIQSDGKILVLGGYAYGDERVALGRHNTDGSLDASFGSGGVTVVNVPGIGGASLASQPDGKILVGGQINELGSNEYMVMRLNVDGSTDTSFDGDGVFVVSGSGNAAGDVVAALAFQSDGRLIVAGDTAGPTYTAAVVRLVLTCGNSVVDSPPEVCDDGNLVSGDGCDINCTLTTCGNRVVSAGEQCDDGNVVDGDGCDTNCSVTGCPNGIQTAGEICDDGNASNGDTCDNNCTIPSCGNGAVAPGEVCDDANPMDGDGCDSNCQASACGNGVVARGHSCDATATSGASCVELCDASWENVLGAQFGEITSIAASGYDLYVAGGVDGIGGVRKWDGASVSLVAGDVDGDIWAMAFDGADMYVGGGIASAGGVPAVGIAKWNGSTWSALGSSIDGEVSALQLIGSDLYVGGSFAIAGGLGANNIAKWNGSSWSLLGSGVDNQVRAMARLGNDLYVAGSFTLAGGIPANYIAKWDGSAWTALGSGTPGDVNALAVLGTDVYAGGADFLMKWNGSSWSTVGSYAVTAMVSGGGSLFVSSNFGADPNLLGVPARFVARWDGTAWHGLGSGLDAVAEQGMAWGGSRLFIAGQFTVAGGKPVANLLASWKSSTCGEQCDDGNAVEGDGCDNDCSASICGNRRVAGAEICDDGNHSNGDTCDNNCTPPACGNGIAGAGEMCDDGNAVSGDGCEADCRITPVVQMLPGPGTVSTDTGSGATPEVPVQTSVATTTGGTVSIAPPSTPEAQEGLMVLGTQLRIEAPTATVANPLTIVLTIEGTALPEGVTYDRLDISRDGSVIPDCTDSMVVAAIPGPSCVQGRVVLVNGDIQITVYSEHASLWSVVVRGLYKGEQKCVNGIDKGALKVASAQAGLAGKCLKSAAAGDEGDPQGCVGSDAAGKIGGAVAKTSEFAVAKCVPPPPFGFTSSGAVVGSAKQAMLQLVADILGADLNASAASDDPGASCQAAVFKATTKLFLSEAKSLQACKKSGLAGKTSLIVSNVQLPRCLDELAADGKGKIAKAITKLGDTIAGKCDGLDLSTTLAGACGTGGDVAACLGNRVSCRVCRMFNAAENLNANCDTFDNGTAEGSCN